jgi:polyhydroxyalkanoate synthase subunit PhaC
MQHLEKAFNMPFDTIEKTSGFLRKLEKLNEIVMSPPEIRTGQTPSEVVYRKHKVKLLRYKPVVEQVFETPVLISFALINKPYILDLIPGKSVVEVLVNAGFDVFLVDWGTPGKSENNYGFDEYINYYMNRIVDQTIRISGSKQVNLLGYCMGGAMSLMYTSLYPEKVRNLILMATPFDFSRNDGILYEWSKDFPVEELIDIYGNCPGWYLNLSFAAMKPFDRIDKSMNFYNNVENEKFVNLFMAMEKWANDTKPIAGRAYVEFIKECFQENKLMKNQFMIGEKPVNIRNITCPVLNIVAGEDTLVPPSSSLEIADYTSSADKELITCQTGHIGLSVSGKALKQLWPQTVDWMSKRSGDKKTIDTKEK